MDWDNLTHDIKLMNDIVNRFTELGCTEKKALELATLAYTYNLPIVIKTEIISDTNKNKSRL